MSESRHRELPGAADTADRESRAEALLVEGLDEYFQGHFEEAIHLWTRVLFVDRAHARARAYINRARTAQSERLRRADEMLHAAGDLLARGDLDQARRLLANAEQTSGADEKVAELWARLERVERTRGPGSGRESSAAGIVDARPVRSVWWSLRIVAQGLAASAFAVFLFTLAVSPVVGEWIAGQRGAPAGRGADEPPPLEVLTIEDAALVRARSLYARGRLAEALVVLDGVGSVDERHDVDQLRVEIQRLLLSNGRTGAVRPPEDGVR